MTVEAGGKQAGGLVPWWADALSRADGPFLADGTARGEIFGRARMLGPSLARIGPEGRVCLLATERDAILAAVLASLANGPALILPQSADAAVLEEVRASADFDGVVSDSAVPGGIAIPKEASPAAPTPLGRDPDAPFLWLFTGGSTGKPRLWSKTPRNLLQEALDLTRGFAVGHEDVILSTAPPQHIYGLLFSVLIPFVSGARILGATHYLPEEIARGLSTSGATLLVGGPAHYRALGADLHAPTLRLAFSSGGFLAPADGDRFSAATDKPVIEIYGSTETGGVATRNRYAGETAWTPLEGARVRIAGNRLEVGSAYLSPELPVDADGYVTSSDRAEPSPDGRFVLLGRADGVVKVAGKRVDLALVEEALRELPGVRDALVLALPVDTVRGVDVAALVVTDLDARAVRAAVASRLPAEATPRRVLAVSEIPTRPTGKRDVEAARALFIRGEGA